VSGLRRCQHRRLGWCSSSNRCTAHCTHQTGSSQCLGQHLHITAERSARRVQRNIVAANARGNIARTVVVVQHRQTLEWERHGRGSDGIRPEAPPAAVPAAAAAHPPAATAAAEREPAAPSVADIELPPHLAGYVNCGSMMLGPRETQCNAQPLQCMLLPIRTPSIGSLHDCGISVYCRRVQTNGVVPMVVDVAADDLDLPPHLLPSSRAGAESTVSRPKPPPPPPPPLAQ
jgi:hypothetical protein